MGGAYAPGTFPVALHVQSWMNAHRANISHESGLAIHDHKSGWHGYLLIDASPSNTSYVSPMAWRKSAGGSSDEHVVFSLNNSDGTLVLLCGGVRHGVAPISAINHFVGSRPRVSMAFDLQFSTRARGQIWTHPMTIFDGGDNHGSTKVNQLDDSGTDNMWKELAGPEELQKRLGVGKTPTAFDFTAVSKDYRRPRKPHLKQLPVTWGGIVQLEELFGDAGLASQSARGHDEL